ncbi:MAG: hypothetical protein KAT68_17855 [Bacteroidales bacterium]|nr:hypothetical protein [Bacteroidales bacterium]
MDQKEIDLIDQIEFIDRLIELNGRENGDMFMCLAVRGTIAEQIKMISNKGGNVIVEMSPEKYKKFLKLE